MTQTETETKAPQVRYLIVQQERSNGYFHLRARVITDRYDNGERLPSGVDGDRYSDGLLYGGLMASCQGDEGSRKADSFGGAVYGYGSCEYRDVFSIELREAKRMVKTLTKIDKGLAKLTAVRGYTRSYGEFIGRLAEVLGCEGMVFQQSSKRYQTTGEKYRWMSIGEGVNEANNAIWQWQQEIAVAS